MPILEIENLTKSFRPDFWARLVHALKGINLQIEENEIFGYLGPNGAGKTTTIKAILGLIQPTSGQIKMFGKPASAIELKQNIGYLPENPYFYTYLTGYEILDFYAQLFDIPAKERRERALKLLETVGMSQAKDRLLRNVSKGMLQRIGIAQALINDPKLVILDEPMSGLDPIGRKEVRDIILRLKDEGKTIFFSSHILSDVEMICDRVAIVSSGKVVSLGNIEEMLTTSVTTVDIRVKGLPKDGVDELRGHNYRLIISSDQVLITVEHENEVEALLELLRQHRGKLISVVPNKLSLEDLFMRQLAEVKKNEN